MNNFAIWLIPGFLLGVLAALGPSKGGFFCALAIQVACFIAVVLAARHRGNRTMSCVGAFSFAYLLFFVGRPLFMVVEDDKALFAFPLAVNVSFEHIYRGLLWLSGGLVAFLAGASLVKGRDAAVAGPAVAVPAQPGISDQPGVSAAVVSRLLLLQLISTILIFIVGGAGRRNVVEVSSSAYVYFLPSVVQSVHIIAVMVILDRQRHRRFGQQFSLAFVFSMLLLLLYTYYMRNVSAFRGYYITGAVAAFLSSLMCLRGRVGYLWIVIPMLFLLPFITQLGAMRTLSNHQIRTYIDQNEIALFGLSKFWTTFSSSGDFNLFDTFIAAEQSTPKSQPYVLQWLYTLVHWVPRAFWNSKPPGGMLIDMDFTNKAPFSPGLSGLFYLEGGHLWMLLGLLVVGVLLAKLDRYQFGMKESFFKFCFYGIMVSNSFFAPRVLLYASIYQTLYMLAPCWILNRWIARSRTAVEDPLLSLADLPALKPAPAPPLRRQRFNPASPDWQNRPG